MTEATIAPESAPPPRVEEVSPGIFAYVQLDGGWYLNNSGFLVGQDGVVVVDTTSTERRARALIDAIESVTDLPRRLLINTHHHGDHTHGNYLFPASAIVGHERCRTAVLASGVGGSRIFGDVEWGDLRVAPPFVTFTDSLRVHVDDLAVELHHVGPAHTDNDVYAWVPERRVLFAGDLVFNAVTPLLVMGSLVGALAALANLRSLQPEVVVPGHGVVSGPEAFDEVEAYVRLVLRAAEAGRDDGKLPLEVARSFDLGRFRDWPDAERLVANIHRAYADLDGVAPGAPVDIGAAFGDMIEVNGGAPLRCLA